VGQFVGLTALEGRNVLQDRFFIQVKTDHLGDKGVHRLVIRHPGADRVGQHHIARTIGGKQAGDAEHGVRIEGQRVEKRIVEAAIDHVHGLGAVGGTHENAIIAHEQVGALHQFHAHFPGEESMLKERTVETPGGQHHHAGVIQGAGAFQGVEQQVGVVVDRRDTLGREQFGEQAHHHLAVFEHVADAAGRA